MKSNHEDEEIRIIGGSNWHSASDKSPLSSPQPKSRSSRRSLLKVGMGVILGVAIALLCGFYYYHEIYVYRFSYPLSRTQTEVMALLAEPREAKVPGVEMVSDSVLGVPMKIFKIAGLKAELCKGIPNLSDPDIYFVTRCSDYRYQKDRQVIIGDYIQNGQKLSHNAWRAGYFAILDGRAEIGIGRRPDMREYVMEHGGSMFRQFALVSAGIKCVSQYALKGKVTRCAYARMSNNDLYFVETVHPETLFGFSDALIEYGFVDAIYVTGGAQRNLFYRDASGKRYGNYVDDRSHRMVVWKRSL